MSTTALPGETDDSAGMLPAAGQAEFAAELSRLSASSGLGDRDRLVRLLGVLLCVAGAVVVLLAYRSTTQASDLRDQLEMAVLGVFGLLLAVVGSVVYAVCSMQRFLRFWLVRLMHEQRDLAGKNRV